MFGILYSPVFLSYTSAYESSPLRFRSAWFKILPVVFLRYYPQMIDGSASVSIDCSCLKLEPVCSFTNQSYSIRVAIFI